MVKLVVFLVLLPLWILHLWAVLWEWLLARES